MIICPKELNNYELAELDYINGMKYKDIAEKYNVSINTVKSWKTRYGWYRNKDKKSMHTKSKKVCTQKKNACENKNKTLIDEVQELSNNNELTDKQKLFCVIYSQCLNATKAYMKAYKCTYETAMVNGSKLLSNTRVKAQLDILIAAKCNKEFLQRSVIQKYIDIAFADIGDYVQFGQRYKLCWTKDKDGNDVPVIDPETGEQKVITYNYLDLKESNLVDTTLIEEVSEGKQGIKFKLADKMKALDFLTKHCNLLNDEEKTKLDIENKKLQNEKLRAEIRERNCNDENEELENDGFIDALKSEVDNVWGESKEQEK